MNYEVPYQFVLRYLFPIRPKIKKMLGGYFLFLDKKILMFLRDSDKSPEFNGIFVATEVEFFEELQNELHRSRMDFDDFDGRKDTWIFISEDLDDFEAKAKKACEMVKAKDGRIGRMP